MSELDKLRQEIDAIDGKIHDLINQCAHVVQQIKMAKQQDNLAQNQAKLPLRPEREISMLQNLLHRHEAFHQHDEGFPSQALLQIWHELIGAFTQMQAPFTLAIGDDDQERLWRFARNQFGIMTPMIDQQNQADLLIVSPKDDLEKFIIKQNRVLFMTLPFSHHTDCHALVLARHSAQATQHDVGLLKITLCDKSHGLDSISYIECQQKSGVIWGLFPHHDGTQNEWIKTLKKQNNIRKIEAYGHCPITPAIKHMLNR